MFEEEDYMDMQAPAIVTTPCSPKAWGSGGGRGPRIETKVEDEDVYTEMRTTPLHSMSLSSSAASNMSPSSGANSPSVTRRMGPGTAQLGLAGRLKMGGYAKNDDDDYDNLPPPSSLAKTDDVYTTMIASPLQRRKTPSPAMARRGTDGAETYATMTGASPRTTPSRRVVQHDSVYADMTPKKGAALGRKSSQPDVRTSGGDGDGSFRGRSSALSIHRDDIDVDAAVAAPTGGLTPDARLKRAKTIKSNRAAKAVQKYLEMSEMERSLSSASERRKERSVTMRNVYASSRVQQPRSQHSLDRKYVEWLAQHSKGAGSRAQVVADYAANGGAGDI